MTSWSSSVSPPRLDMRHVASSPEVSPGFEVRNRKTLFCGLPGSWLGPIFYLDEFRWCFLDFPCIISFFPTTSYIFLHIQDQQLFLTQPKANTQATQVLALSLVEVYLCLCLLCVYLCSTEPVWTDRPLWVSLRHTWGSQVIICLLFNRELKQHSTTKTVNRMTYINVHWQNC